MGIRGLNWGLREALGGGDVRMDVQMDGRKEIHPCVLQDIVPLGPLPSSHSTSSADHSKQGIGYC